MDLAALRNEFERHHLDEADCPNDPVILFERWFTQAVEAACPEPNAMSLATVGPDGRPANRIVYLKGVEEGGFHFFTNTTSRKGRDLEHCPAVAAVLFWPALERQVRIEGTITRLSRELSEVYFASRPRLSQLGAWASRQSRPVPDRQHLIQALEQAERRYPGPVPCPAEWGGYAIGPDRIEFWQGRPGRLHDRILYRRHPEGVWQRQRLSP